MICVSTASYGVLTNGVPRSTILPSRGNRQGDPLSPYLYLIFVERLSYMLHKTERNTPLKGVKVACDSPPITHLFFVDDYLIFCSANAAEWKTIQRLLHNYELASRQGFNKYKLDIF